MNHIPQILRVLLTIIIKRYAKLEHQNTNRYECATLEQEELVDLIRVPLKKYHNDKELCFDPMTIPTCSNDVPGACDHVENCTLPPPSSPPSSPPSNPSHPSNTSLTERKLSLARVLKFDDINSLIGCATIDVATAMSAEGGYVVDYTTESCTVRGCSSADLFFSLTYSEY